MLIELEDRTVINTDFIQCIKEAEYPVKGRDFLIEFVRETVRISKEDYEILRGILNPYKLKEVNLNIRELEHRNVFPEIYKL